MPGIQTILHPTDFSENSRLCVSDGLRFGPGLPCDFARSPCHDALRVARCWKGRRPIRCGPPNPRNPSRNCPGPNRRTRRFAWSIGWPKETPRKRSFA